MIFHSFFDFNIFMKRFRTHVYRTFSTPHSDFHQAPKLCALVWENLVYIVVIMAIQSGTF
jgi:hypothetical protein